jgi:hypothetical protein
METVHGYPAVDLDTSRKKSQPDEDFTRQAPLQDGK